MSAYRAQPGGVLTGELTVPGDKSISHRALMLGGIAHGDTEITGFLAGEDCLATLRALRQLGVGIEHAQDQHVIVHGAGSQGLRSPPGPLDLGNAGTAMRLFMGLLCGQPFDSVLIGDESLMRRPMERVAKPLRQMGADVETQEGLPPVAIRGGRALSAIDYELPVASAQVKSALLLAGLQAGGITRITEPAPTRDHTERMLRAFAVPVQKSGSTLALEGGCALQGARVLVPADFSSAAFFLVGGCLAAERELVLRNVGVNPTRTGLLQLLLQMGADIRLYPHQGTGEGEPIADIVVRRSELRGISVGGELAALTIDEFPVFFIAAACAQGETVVRDAAELRVKETDRLAVMSQGLARLGVENRLQPDGLWIAGGRGFAGGSIDSCGDHRIAMAFSIAALRARDPIEIRDVANVATSFPGFQAVARKAGLQIESH